MTDDVNDKTEDRGMSDEITAPAHYQGLKESLGIEVIDLIEAMGWGYHLGNVCKYLFRHEYKGHALKDLQKCLWYLDRYIEDLATINDRADAAVEETMKDLVTRRLDRSRRIYRESRSGICRARERSSMDEPTVTLDWKGFPGLVDPEQPDSYVIPTVTSWPPDDHDFSDGPGAAEAIKFQADHSPDYVTLPGATTPPETLVNTSSSSRVGGQVRIDAYDDYYGFNDDEVITKCGLPTCGKDIQAKDTYVTVGSKDFCGVPCLSTYRGVHGV